MAKQWGIIICLLTCVVSVKLQELSVGARAGYVLASSFDFFEQSAGILIAFRKRYFLSEFSFDRFYFSGSPVNQKSAIAGVTLPFGKYFSCDAGIGVGYYRVDTLDNYYPRLYSSFYIAKKLSLNFRPWKRLLVFAGVDFGRLYFVTSPWLKSNLACSRGTLGLSFSLIKQ